MKKQVTIYICDVCKDEENKDNLKQCFVCGRDVCESCFMEFEYHPNPSSELVICKKCGNETKIRRITREFYKLPKIKKLIAPLMEEYVLYLKNNIIADEL